MHRIAAITVFTVCGTILAALGQDRGTGTNGHADQAVLKPVASTNTGILLEPPIDLSRFTRQEFEAYSSTIGRDRIRRPWTSAITPLPPRPGDGVRALVEPEIKEIMLQVRDLFDAGKAVPLSDVGLISTHEDVNRKPMYNHVSAFASPSVNAYLLVQRLQGGGGWGYFSIVQDLKTEPPTDYYGEINGREIKFEGKSCYKCHSSGPLALHPAREDLVSDVPLLKAINRHIAGQPVSRIHIPERERPDNEYGEPLKLEACAKCHDDGADRAPLFRAHSHPIRMLVDFGHMPPGRLLKPEEMAELKAWLEAKP